MAELYSKDYLKLKTKWVNKLEDLIETIPGLKESGEWTGATNAPKMQYRASRSLLVSPDYHFRDILEQAETEKWDARKVADAIRNKMEPVTKREKGKVPTFRPHHTVSLSSFGDAASALQEASPEKFRQLLNELYERGYRLGEEGLEFFPERAHTGSTALGNIKKPYKEAILNVQDQLQPGLNIFSAHGGNPANKAYYIDPKLVKGDPRILLDKMIESFDRQALDVLVGRELSAPVWKKMGEVLERAGMPTDNPRIAFQFFHNVPEAMAEVEAAFKTPTKVTPALADRFAAGGLTKAQRAVQEAMGGMVEVGDRLVNAAKYRAGFSLVSNIAETPGLRLGANVIPLAGAYFSFMGLQANAKEFRKNPTKHNFLKLTGSAVETTGEALSAGGLVAAPFTGGASLALTAVGETMSLAGTGTELSTIAHEKRREIKQYASDTFRDKNLPKIRGRYGAKKVMEKRREIKRRQKELESTASAYDWRNPPDEPLW